MDTQQTFAITRPHESLMKYYILQAIASGPGIFIMLPLLYFRFHTMRFRFDEEGISMSWGILFRHEIVLNYARIQDVHLKSNVVERWLGLARIDVQTASGGSAPEMTLEGIPQYEALRDFLYSKMRGAKEHPHTAQAPDGVASTLHAIAEEMRAIRKIVEDRGRV